MPIRPANVSKPLKIYQWALDKAALDAMPEDARRVFFLFGHIGNEINTLSRLLILSVEKQSDPILRVYSEARAATIARLLVGTTREGFLAVERRILGSLFNVTYIPYLEPEGQKALIKVKGHLGKMKLMADIRNGFSFHNPHDDQIDNAYRSLPRDEELSFYSGLPRHSSLYAMSNSLITQAMLDLVDDPDSEKSMQAIIDDVLDKAAAINDFIEQLLITIIDREALSPGDEKEVLTVDTHESTMTFKIPPLLRT
jgi:hypothetical protein